MLVRLSFNQANQPVKSYFWINCLARSFLTCNFYFVLSWAITTTVWGAYTTPHIKWHFYKEIKNLIFVKLSKTYSRHLKSTVILLFWIELDLKECPILLSICLHAFAYPYIFFKAYAMGTLFQCQFTREMMVGQKSSNMTNFIESFILNSLYVTADTFRGFWIIVYSKYVFAIKRFYIALALQILQI